MSRKTFESLTLTDRDLILTVARESVPYMRGLWDKMTIESREKVVAAGVKVNEVERPAFVAAVQPVLQRYLQRPDLMSLYKAMRELA